MGPSAGCTAVCAVVRGNELWVANAGDSRCLFSRNGTAVSMTTDHKPNDADEYARIVKVWVGAGDQHELAGGGGGDEKRDAEMDAAVLRCWWH